jgi:hypothetical protein
MSSFPIREKAIAACLAAGAVLVMLWFGVRGAGLVDWNVEARPAVDALLAGHGFRFLQLAPTYGGSLILRSPFMFIMKLWHDGNAAIYTASAVPGLAATAALGIWLGARMRKRGGSLLACALVILLCTANPLALPALQFGHPEELLGAALCVAAVLCAMDQRPIWAAVLLGLAIPNKEWAVLAVGPMLVMLHRGRFRSLVIIGAVAGTVLAPLVIGATGGFVAQTSAAGLNTGSIFQPWQIWWFFGSQAHVVSTVIGTYRVSPGWVARLGHTLVIALMPPMSALYAWLPRTRARRRPNDVLLLLTLLLALRCVLDPWDVSYYSVPFLLALLAWESLSFDRPPVLTMTASFATWLIFRETGWGALNLLMDQQALAFAIVSIPSVIGLALAVYAPGVLPGLDRRRRRAPVVPAVAQAGA